MSPEQLKQTLQERGWYIAASAVFGQTGLPWYAYQKLNDAAFQHHNGKAPVLIMVPYRLDVHGQIHESVEFQMSGEIEDGLSIKVQLYSVDMAKAVETIHKATTTLLAMWSATQPAQIKPSTPAAHWRETGEEDPHAGHYDQERAALTLGKLTDDELANAAFMNYDQRPNLQDIIDGKAFSPIVYMTAVKDRIRWLSRSLERVLAELTELKNRESRTKEFMLDVLDEMEDLGKLPPIEDLLPKRNDDGAE